ncbi:GTP-binding protein [Clostridium sp. BL-8]|uniref:GTP-binding protein n=1 Tax=Clostridium sp. BL-8 TaxID=349938 RepID=UPI00098CAE3A|nr:GTP-binding protein [Clostridium sp. BL-8]OOM78471.1 circadian clock protein KaiC [Clostridium sp. BL-8]
MKIHIEIVTGFLGAGKTSFINSFLKESQVEDEKVLVFQLEEGERSIKQYNDLIKVKTIKNLSNLKEEMIFLIKEFNPNRVIVEYNGTYNLKELFDMLNEKIYRECSKITTIFFVADGRNLKQYIDNVGSFVVPFIQYANMIVVNNIDNCNKKILEEGFKKIKELNSKAFLLKVNNKYILNSVLRESKMIDNGYLKRVKIKIANSKLSF